MNRELVVLIEWLHLFQSVFQGSSQSPKFLGRRLSGHKIFALYGFEELLSPS